MVSKKDLEATAHLSEADLYSILDARRAAADKILEKALEKAVKPSLISRLKKLDKKINEHIVNLVVETKVPCKFDWYGAKVEFGIDEDYYFEPELNKTHKAELKKIADKFQKEVDELGKEVKTIARENSLEESDIWSYLLDEVEADR